MIRFDNVTKRYDGRAALEHATIHIEKGDFVFLVGPSGAGKSTFIKLLLKEIDSIGERLIRAHVAARRAADGRAGACGDRG